MADKVKTIHVMLTGLVLVALLAVYLFSINRVNNMPDLLKSVAIMPAKPVSSFTLVDHNNKPVTTESLKDNWTFVFFGFTNCPDVCPATLLQLALLKKELDKSPEFAKQAQYFFVSVDPERDNLEHLKKYVTYFNKSFIAVTGKPEQILNFEKQLGAFHRLGKANKQGNYDVQHSGEIFLINAAGELAAKFRPPIDTAEIAQQFNLIVTRYGSKLG